MNNSVDDDPARGRESGIVPVAERKGAPGAGPTEPEKFREIEIDTDDVAEKEGAAKSSPASSLGAESSAPDEETIEVLDDEIEALPVRPSQASPPSSSGVPRSRPPVRPSVRTHLPSGSSALPPPRPSGSASSLPPSSRSSLSGADPWLLANKTLELSRAHARITELEEHVAFRDAQIDALDEKLNKAQLKIQELERRVNDAPSVGRSNSVRPAPEVRVDAPTPRLVVEKPVVTEKPVVAEKPVVTETRRVAAAKAAASEPPQPASRNVSAKVPAGDERAAELDKATAPLHVDGAAEPLAGAEAAGIDTGTGEPEEDLCQISGIGPRFEAALRKQGITRLSQIAAWSDADVRHVAKALKIPKSRIVKGRWVESAREAIGTRAVSE